jgi:dihydropteroate synthase
MAVERGAHVIRTHDVAETRDAALVGDAFTRDRLRTAADDVTVEELDVTSPRELRRHLDRLGDDETLARGGTIRVFELGGLSPKARAALEDAARGTDAVVAGVTGDDRRILAGTPAALSTIETSMSGRSDALSRVIELIAENEH